MINCVRTALFVMGLVTFAFQAMAHATIYKWQDAEGSTHFTDDLTRVPPSFRDQALVQDLPEESRNVTPAPSPVPAPPAGDLSPPADEYAECLKRVQEEKERWTRKLEEDQDRLVELNRMIHRAVTARKRNQFQRERVAVKDRIARAGEALRDTVPPMEHECESIRYWQGGG